MATSKLDSLVSKTGPFGFYRPRLEATVEDYCARDSSSSLFVSSRTHAQPKEEDPMNESTEVERGRGQEGKRWTLQHYSACVPDEEKMEGEEKVDTPAPMTSDDDMDLLDDDEVPMIKDGSPPPSCMDINMVFTLPTKDRGLEEDVAQMCLGPKEVMFEKLKELSQHMKPLYIWGHIDGRPISWMLINGGAAVNLMLYSVFKKLGWEDDELMKTNLTLNDVGGGQLDGG
jgi:hypothetical protein